MKKFAKIFVCILLLSSVILSLASCDFIDSVLMKNNSREPVRLHDPNLFKKTENGYTGGYSILAVDHKNREMHWMETYDELKLAIDHLIKAGNKIGNSLIPTYENEIVDAKYFVMLKDKDWKPLSEGQEWYDREGVDSIHIYYVGFLEEVTIETIERNYVSFYKSFNMCTNDYSLAASAVADGISYACIECGYDADYKKVVYMEDEEQCFIMTEKSEKPVATIKYNKMENHSDELPENFHQDFIDSIVILKDHKYYQNGELLG